MVNAYRARIQQEYQKNMTNLLLFLFLFYYAYETCEGRDKICPFIEYTPDFIIIVLNIREFNKFRKESMHMQ